MQEFQNIPVMQEINVIEYRNLSLTDNLIISQAFMVLC